MNRLRFLHIPKTAGTTFRAFLERQYRPEEIFAFADSSGLSKFHELPPTQQASVRLFMGHAPLITGVREADEAAILTILREPVSRVKSFCQHVSEGKSEYLLSEFPPEGFDLDRFIASGNGELCNLQTKMLINRGKIGDDDLVSRLAPQEAIERALDSLFNKVAIYGIQERFDESLLVFAARFGWKTPFYRSLNAKRSERGLTFADTQIERIRELNALDAEVYRQAVERFPSISRQWVSESSYRKFCYLNTKVYPRFLYWKWKLSGLRA